MMYTVENVTRGARLGDKIDRAESSRERRTGLMKHSILQAGEGLWIDPCEGVHTFFMKFPIDVIYLDRNDSVRKIRHALRPWRLSLCLAARSVLELPAGTVLSTGTCVGDRLKFQEA